MIQLTILLILSVFLNIYLWREWAEVIDVCLKSLNRNLRFLYEWDKCDNKWKRAEAHCKKFAIENKELKEKLGIKGLEKLLEIYDFETLMKELE